MTQRMGIEDAFQQRLTQLPTEVGSPGEVAVEGIMPTDDNQRADPLAHQIGGRLGKDFRTFVEGGDIGEPLPETAQQGQTFEETSEILLEDHDEDEQQDRKKGLKHHGGQVELEE